MKAILVFAFAVVAAGCANTGQPVANSTANQSTTTASPKTERIESVAAHTTENQTPKPADTGAPPAGQSRWTQSGDPIDTAKLDAAVMSAEKALAADSKSPTAKKALASAYLARATALTEARQYASALGDYRRTLKHDPDNAEAKQWVDQITQIYTSINRAYPKEGEEPPPLPFKKPA